MVEEPNEFADFFGDEAAEVLDRAVDRRLAEAGHPPVQQSQRQQPKQQAQEPEQPRYEQPQGQHDLDAAANEDAILDAILDGDTQRATKLAERTAPFQHGEVVQ